MMRQVGLQLIADKKATIVSEKAPDASNSEKRDLKNRDLLSLLLRANIGTDIPESQRLNDEEVLAREFHA